MDNATVIAPDVQQEQDQVELVTDELLVEEISIDGMCGVY
jgi:mycofactocin precursor